MITFLTDRLTDRQTDRQTDGQTPTQRQSCNMVKYIKKHIPISINQVISITLFIINKEIGHRICLKEMIVYHEKSGMSEAGRREGWSGGCVVGAVQWGPRPGYCKMSSYSSYDLLKTFD